MIGSLVRVLALAACCALTLGCVGGSEADAWGSENEAAPDPVQWEGDSSREDSKDRRVSTNQGANTATPARQRQVARGPGWQVSVDGGRPVETFASAEAPGPGFAPTEGPAQKAAPKRTSPPRQPGPWLEVPMSEPEAEGPERTRLKVKAKGVDVVSGRCGPVPVARYGLDWSPDREWRLGQDPNPEPWQQPIPPLPEPPKPEPPPAQIEPKEAPAGTLYEAR